MFNFDFSQSPSTTEFMTLISRYKDDESRQNFLVAHHEVLNTIRGALSDNIGHQSEYQIIEEICKHTGHHFPSILTELVRLSYYRKMFPSFVVNVRTTAELAQGSRLYPGVDALENNK